MHQIQLQIYKFLQDLGSKPYKIPDDILTKFGAETQKALQKQFERTPRHFHLSMSNVGKPLCQLQYEKLGIKGEQSNNIVRNLYGDICEDIVLFLLYASKVKVVEALQRVSLQIADTTLNGEFDVLLDLGNGLTVWDIKSASDWAFRNKFSEDMSFDTFMEQDTYGYVPQLFLYGEALDKGRHPGTKAGGWIVVDKSSGEIKIVSVPEERYDTYRRSVLNKVHENVTAVSSFKQSSTTLSVAENVQKQFDPKPEIFRSKPTGNKCLPTECTFCPWKSFCWPALQIRPQAKSTSKNPKLVYYTEYNETNNNKS